ncbi:hypothetical protein ABZT50_38890, partial [Streptomyces sp. NPDC005505]
RPAPGTGPTSARHRTDQRPAPDRPAPGTGPTSARHRTDQRPAADRPASGTRPDRRPAPDTRARALRAPADAGPERGAARHPGLPARRRSGI